MSATTTPLTPKRRRGAQPGNVNALRHGRYTRLVTGMLEPYPDENLQDDLLSELVLVVLNIASLVLSLEEQILEKSRHA
jgi:hypothetical protein